MKLFLFFRFRGFKICSNFHKNVEIFENSKKYVKTYLSFEKVVKFFLSTFLLF